MFYDLANLLVGDLLKIDLIFASLKRLILSN